MYSSIAFNRQTIAPADDVFAPNKAWQDMSEHWVLIEDLIQGTSHLRSKQRKYLFQELRENDESYDNDLSRSTPSHAESKKCWRDVDPQASAAD